MPHVPRLRCKATLRPLTSPACTTSRIIHVKNTNPCKCTIGGAGGNVPRASGNRYVMPKPVKTKNAITTVIQKKNDGLNVRSVTSTAEAADALIRDALLLVCPRLPAARPARVLLLEPRLQRGVVGEDRRGIDRARARERLERLGPRLRLAELEHRVQ